MQVDRRTVGVVMVGVVGALALAFAAGTLTSPAAQGGGSLLSIEGNSTTLFQADDPQDIDSSPLPDVGPVVQILFLGLFVLTTAVAVYVLSVRDLITIVSAVVLAGLAFWLFMEVISALSGEGGDFGFAEDTGIGIPGGAGGFGPQAIESAPPSPFLLGSIGLVALLALVVLFGLSTDETPAEPEAESEDDDVTPETLTPVGAAAGRAADQLADGTASTSNVVYRAWVDMTAALAVPNRQSTTPGEFAEAAIEAGMKPRDVEELTRLFEDVRYGDASVSEQRERRATEALRRIESTYAGDET
ncbi:Uncharacterized protein SVXHr_2141 [Halorhabdus sp. SVX81]|nr:Uncharacterized protein SVXHr_2141 [Halorhabdus sp. SVX81]